MDREEEDGGSNVPMTGSVSEASANGFLHTTRFEHVEDEHGHHILTGREGKLTRCEDEVRVMRCKLYALLNKIAAYTDPGRCARFWCTRCGRRA